MSDSNNPATVKTEDDVHPEGEAHPESGDHGHEVTEEEWREDPTTYGMAYHLSNDHLIGHVQDQTFFEIPKFDFKNKHEIGIPNPTGIHQ